MVKRPEIHVYVTELVHVTWHAFAAENGVSVTGLLEALGLQLADEIKEVGNATSIRQDWVEDARKLVAGRRRRGEDCEPAGERLALHGYVSEAAYEAWHTLASENGVSVTVLVEVLGRQLKAEIDEAGDAADVRQDWVRQGRKIDAQRRRRNRHGSEPTKKVKVSSVRPAKRGHQKKA